MENKNGLLTLSIPIHWILPFMESKYCAKQPRNIGSYKKLMQAIIWDLMLVSVCIRTDWQVENIIFPGYNETISIM